jgi:scyllo-inositol 2-dehydrogenase (NADP+)
MIRVGLIGYGLAGAVFHEPLIEACERLGLNAVFTSREHPLRVSTIDELLKRSDLVVIASPNQTHFPLAKAALESGRHVVVDKPFTVSLAEADELIGIAKICDRTLTVFHNRRWDGDFLTVKRVLPELGEVQLFEANWDRFRPAIKQGWREEEAPGSGVLNDLGPHLIDQALQLFGMPSTVSADIAIEREGAKVDDCFELALHYGHMRACLRSSTLRPDPRPRFSVHGTKGAFVKHGLDPQEGQLKDGLRPGDAGFGETSEKGMIVLADGSARTLPTERGDYLAFYEAVAASISEGAPVPVAPEEARDGLLTIDLARRAAQECRPISVPGASSLEA